MLWLVVGSLAGMAVIEEPVYRGRLVVVVVVVVVVVEWY